jgi:glutathione S-transferase
MVRPVGDMSMLKLLYSPPSPYSAKVRMAATYAGVELEAVKTDTNNPSGELLKANPLGKIPVLLTEDGGAVSDSTAILYYLDRVSKGALFPRNAAKRTEAERLEALADGICDCLLAHVYERRFRPEEKIHQDWLDKQWTKVTRALDALNAAPPKLPKKITAGQIALRACLGYLQLRFEGKWERGRPRLARWAKKFDEKFPDIAELAPKG